MSLKECWEKFCLLIEEIMGGEIVLPSNPTPMPTPTPAPANTLLWDTLPNIKHSVRVICDEEGLNLEQKNTLFATVWAESGFDLNAVCRNYVTKNGVKILASTDWGICQWNDYWHIKEITPDEATHDPEKAVRLMCAYWLRGQRNQWVAYSSGIYKKYL